VLVPSRCGEVIATIFIKRAHLRRAAVSPIRRFGLLCPFELGIKGIKTFEAFGEDLLIGQTLLCPTFEDLFNSEAFDPMKLFVFQIRVMNQLEAGLWFLASFCWLRVTRLSETKHVKGDQLR
jgi:hypothetical protein